MVHLTKSGAGPVVARTARPASQVPAGAPKRTSEPKAGSIDLGDFSDSLGPAPTSIDQVLSKNLRRALGGFKPSTDGLACPELETPRLQKALGLVSEIDLLDPSNKKDWGQAIALYEHSFPNPDEREEGEVIAERLRAGKALAAKGVRPGEGGAVAPFHVLTAKNKAGQAVGYYQFTLLPVGKDKTVIYGQYYAVADKDFMLKTHHRAENPRQQGVLSALYASAWALAKAESKVQGRTFVGSIHETEMKDQADSQDARNFTYTRLGIHNQCGARILMLRRPDGTLHTPHVQPALSEDSSPIRLHLMMRPATYQAGDERKSESLSVEETRQLTLDWLENFRREGFSEAEILEAEASIKKQFEEASGAILIPKESVPTYAELAAVDPELEQQYRCDFAEDPDMLRRLDDAQSSRTAVG